VIFSWNNFVFGIVLAGRESAHVAGRRLNMISSISSPGDARRGRADRHVPVLLLTIFAQRQIVAGLTAGAVKGG